MADFTTSPNMNLPVPTVGAAAGPLYAQYVDGCLTIIDQHTHSSGSGVQINPSGININADLPFNINNATLLRTSRYSPAVSPIASSAPDLNCLYVAVTGSNNELYYNDSSGNQVQLTSAGVVNATSSGISSGSATASFVSSVLVVNAAASTPANIQVASVLLGNNSAGTNFITLSPPGALASSYPLVLPTLPPATMFVTLDSSGNFGTASGISGAQIASGSITGSQIAATTITGGNIANDTITGTQVATQGLFYSNLPAPIYNSVFINTSITSGSFTQIGSTVTITTSGNRPLLLVLQPVTGTALSNIFVYQSGVGNVDCTADFQVSEVSIANLFTSRIIQGVTSGLGQDPLSCTPNMTWFIQSVSAGSHTYNLAGRCTVSSGTPTLSVLNCNFYAIEI